MLWMICRGMTLVSSKKVSKSVIKEYYVADRFKFTGNANVDVSQANCVIFLQTIASYGVRDRRLFTGCFV